MENAETIGDLLNQIKDVKLDSLDSAGVPAAVGWAGGWASGFAVATHMWWNWVICILMIISSWFIFAKAKKPGWAAIIPIYSTIVLLEVIKRPWWWIFLLLIPIVNIVYAIFMMRELARVFGQGVGFTIGLILLPFIFLPILAFGDYKYKK